MKQRVRVLLTSAGTATATNVIQALRQSARFDAHIVAVDQDPFAAGLYLADARDTVPSARSANYIERIVEVCRAHELDFVFPLHSTEIPIFAEERGALAERGIGVCVPDANVARLCNEKDQFLAFLAKGGFAFPRTFAHADEVTDFPVFVKPRNGSASSGTLKVLDRAALAERVRAGDDIVIQEFVEWPELTVDCFVARSGRLVGCVPRFRRRVKDGKSMVAETADAPDVVDAVERLLAAIGMRGPCNVQLFRAGPGEIRFVEINPRLAAGGLPLATHVGTNIPELMLREFHGEPLSQRIAYAPGVVMIRYLTELFPGG